MEINQLKSEFIKLYGEGEVRVFIAPARVNLIGEHTDYNGGYVLPCAIGQRSAVCVRKRDDNIINLATTVYPKDTTAIKADINKLSTYKKIPWGNYQLGVASVMQEMGYNIFGMDMLYDETVPYGSGLSSSAAIEVATATVIATLDSEVSGKSIDFVELALIGQKAENGYVGMNCGIMDQFASAMGKSNHAILLRCNDLSFEYAPFDIEKQGYSLIIANTCKPRSLITSAYNVRRSECERAVADFNKVIKINDLCEISPEQYEEHKAIISDEICAKRSKHVIYENARAIEATKLLAMGDIVGFGELLFQSHISLKDLFEVTGIELDTMYYAMRKYGAIGARMTGAGFGGCAIAIVAKEDAESFCIEVEKDYTQTTGLVPKFYTATASDGAREEK